MLHILLLVTDDSRGVIHKYNEWHLYFIGDANATCRPNVSIDFSEIVGRKNDLTYNHRDGLMRYLHQQSLLCENASQSRLDQRKMRRIWNYFVEVH